MELTLKHIIIHNSKTSSGDIVSITESYLREGHPKQPYFKVFLNGRLRGEEYEPSFDGVGVPGKAWDLGNYFCSEKEYLMHTNLNSGFKNAASICLIGSCFSEYTFKQLLNVVLECRSVVLRFDLSFESILGHFECVPSSAGIKCPDIDMKSFRGAVSGAININHQTTLMASLKPKR